MSLGGIAIAVGAMVDASIVVVEQTHKKLEEWQRGDRRQEYRSVVVDAVKEVGGPSFFALLVIAVSFLPVLTLEAQEGRLFRPLAYTKNLTMIAAAILAITLDPAIRLLFTRMKDFDFRPRWIARVTNALLVGKIQPEEKHPVSRLLIRLYQPLVIWSLRWKWAVIIGAVLLVLITVPIYMKLGSEFMPPFDEGALLHADDGAGIAVAGPRNSCESGSTADGVPPVAGVLGKAGRAETATDPAPLSMMETVIRLKPRGMAESQHVV
jgi:Cu(I)/Ag(I) efflux system membrane protein CusA/SilA